MAKPVLTVEELRAARAACEAASAAGRAKAAADKEACGALAQVLFKMGMTLEEAKALDPEVLAAEIARRAGKVFRVEPGAEAFALARSSSGRYPKWKEELLAAVGPGAVAKIEAETAPQYSYTVIEASVAKPGAGLVPLGKAKR